METLNHANYLDWLHFYLPPYTREKKNHLDIAGIKPGPPVWLATMLSITLHASRAFDSLGDKVELIVIKWMPNEKVHDQANSQESHKEGI